MYSTETAASGCLAQSKQLIDDELDRVLKAETPEQNSIVEAMRYSALGGKRLRGIMTMEFANMFGLSKNSAAPFSAAIECVQAYSLIHDDLPCMDDDDFRRGKPACHKAFGEATALLAGDALLTLAFELIAGSGVAQERPDRAAAAALALSRAAGYRGIVCGQMLDLAAAARSVSAQEIRLIHELKTAALMRGAAKTGCAAAGADETATGLADDFAKAFGLAFQITDDLLDTEGDSSGIELNSYVAVHGKEKSRTDAAEYIDQAQKALMLLQGAGFAVHAFEEMLNGALTRKF